MNQLIKTKGLLVALGVMLTLAGCGAPADNGNSAGGTMLKIGVGAIPTTLDPGRATLRQQYSILQLTAGTLTSQDRDGKNFGMRLAASVEPGDKQFVFHLKPGLKFSDGSALTSRDVVATFQYYLADKTSAYRANFNAVEKVEARGDLTVVFDLKRPYPALPFILAYPSSAILPAKSIESRGVGDLYKGDPLPTAGQFTVQAVAQDQITLQANANYVGEQPSTKTVVFKKITDPAGRLAQVRGGQIDYADDITPKSVGQITSPVEAHSAIGINGAQFLVMNNRGTSVLSDVRIRQAISLAINRSQITQVAWSGQTRPVQSLFPDASPYSAPFLQTDSDAQRAKEELADTQCASGCTLRLIVASDNEPRSDVAVVVQQNLKAIGIQVNIEKSESATVAKSSNEGNFDLLISGTYDNIPGGYFAYALGPAVEALHTGYSNAEMDRLLQQVETTSGADLTAAIAQVNAQFAKDMPMAPIAEYSVISASRVPADRFTTDAGFFFHVG